MLRSCFSAALLAVLALPIAGCGGDEFSADTSDGGAAGDGAFAGAAGSSIAGQGGRPGGAGGAGQAGQAGAGQAGSGQGGAQGGTVGVSGKGGGSAAGASGAQGGAGVGGAGQAGAGQGGAGLAGAGGGGAGAGAQENQGGTGGAQGGQTGLGGGGAEGGQTSVGGGGAEQGGTSQGGAGSGGSPPVCPGDVSNGVACDSDLTCADPCGGACKCSLQTGTGAMQWACSAPPGESKCESPVACSYPIAGTDSEKSCYCDKKSVSCVVESNDCPANNPSNGSSCASQTTDLSCKYDVAFIFKGTCICEGPTGTDKKWSCKLGGLAQERRASGAGLCHPQGRG